MKIKVKLVSSLLFFIIASCCFFIEGMNSGDESRFSEYIDNKFCQLDSLNAKMAIDTYDELGVAAMDEKFISKYKLEFFIQVSDKIFNEFGRRDVLVGLLAYKFAQNKDSSFEFDIYLIDLFFKIRSHLDEAESMILYGIWNCLAERLQNLFRAERQKFEDSLPSLRIGLKAKNIVQRFRVFQSFSVGRLYDSPGRTEAYAIAENSDELLAQILVYIFSHFEEYGNSVAEAIYIMKFLFPDECDLKGHNIHEILLRYLLEGYPRLVYVTDTYVYLKGSAPKILELIFYLKSVVIDQRLHEPVTLSYRDKK